MGIRMNKGIVLAFISSISLTSDVTSTSPTLFDRAVADDSTAGDENHASLKLLDDKIEVIPSVVREQSRVEAEGYLGVVLFRALPSEVLRLTCG